MRRALAATAALVAILALAPAAGAQLGFDDRPMDELLISARGQAVRATLGSTCRLETRPDGTATGGCVDTVAGLPVTGELRFAPGETLHFELDHPAVEFGAALHATDGKAPRERLAQLEPTPDTAPPTRSFSARVPFGLPGGRMRIVAFARYDPAANPTGDASFQAGGRVAGPPRGAITAARRSARRRLEGTPRVTFSKQSRRNSRWVLVTGTRGRRIWAAWVRRGSDGRWRVRVFRTRYFDPAGVPCDLAPAFSEARC